MKINYLLLFIFIILFYLIINKENNIKVNKNINNNITILNYHGVSNTTWGISSLFIKVDEFDKQMKYLKDNNYETFFLSEIDLAINSIKPIIITFDDGYVDLYNNAYPILKKYNLKANIFVITNTFDNNKYLNKQMIKEIHSSDLIEIGSHSVTHPNLINLNQKELESELKDSKDILELLLEEKINTFAYPIGYYNDDVIEIVKKYYDYAVTTKQGKNDLLNKDNYILKRIYISRNTKLNSFISYVK